MIEQTTPASDGADTPKEPGFRIQRIYLKDLSLEQPNAPQILLIAAEPQIEVEVDVAVTRLGDEIFEVALISTVTAKVESKVLFLVEAKQAVFLNLVIFLQSKWILCWALLAQLFCILTCVQILPTPLAVLVSSQSI